MGPCLRWSGFAVLATGIESQAAKKTIKVVMTYENINDNG